jgi:hypothetical protein
MLKRVMLCVFGIVYLLQPAVAFADAYNVTATVPETHSITRLSI